MTKINKKLLDKLTFTNWGSLEVNFETIIHNQVTAPPNLFSIWLFREK
jgi:hypothetical protein